MSITTYTDAVKLLAALLDIDSGAISAHPIAAARIEKDLLVWCVEGNVYDVYSLIKTEGFRIWSTDPRRVKDPNDDKAPKLGISKFWARPLSDPLTPIGWLHDLWCRNDFSSLAGLSRRKCERRFLNLGNLFAQDTGNPNFYLAESHLYYRIVRALSGFFWRGKP